MGLFDVITGRRKLKEPAPDRLFAIATAAVTLESAHQITGAGTAAIVFQPLATSEFEATLRDMEEVVRATGAESGIQVNTVDDDYGYRWLVLRGGKVEDLAVGINAVSSSIEAAGHGERLLCAVFGFTGSGGQRIFFIYNYKRGFWYPFVPAAGASGTRQTERELQLQAQMTSELPLEPELERWFPLWGIPI
jgi:PspAB-like protein